MPTGTVVRVSLAPLCPQEEESPCGEVTLKRDRSFSEHDLVRLRDEVASGLPPAARPPAGVPPSRARAGSMHAHRPSPQEQGTFSVSVQSQPDPSSSRPSDPGTAKHRPEASAAPDTHHLWLVSEGGRSPLPRQGSSGCGWVGPHQHWGGWSLLPPPGPSGHCGPHKGRTLLGDSLHLKFIVPTLMRNPAAWALKASSCDRRAHYGVTALAAACPPCTMSSSAGKACDCEHLHRSLGV